jgi:hypothetical protein
MTMQFVENHITSTSLVIDGVEEGFHRDEYPDGTWSGLIADSAVVDPTARVRHNAFVLPFAIVGPGVVVRDDYCVKPGNPKPVYNGHSDP